MRRCFRFRCRPSGADRYPAERAAVCRFRGVLFLDSEILAWSFELPKKYDKKWAERVGKQQVVFECELLPVMGVSGQVFYSERRRSSNRIRGSRS